MPPARPCPALRCSAAGKVSAGSGDPCRSPGRGSGLRSAGGCRGRARAAAGPRVGGRRRRGRRARGARCLAGLGGASGGETGEAQDGICTASPPFPPSCRRLSRHDCCTHPLLPAGRAPSLPPGHPLWPRARRERGGGGRAAPPGPHLPAGRGGPSCLVPAAEANEMGIKRKIYIYTCFWFYTSVLEKVDLGNRI